MTQWSDKEKYGQCHLVLIDQSLTHETTVNNARQYIKKKKKRRTLWYTITTVVDRVTRLSSKKRRVLIWALGDGKSVIAVAGKIWIWSKIWNVHKRKSYLKVRRGPTIKICPRSMTRGSLPISCWVVQTDQWLLPEDSIVRSMTLESDTYAAISWLSDYDQLISQDSVSSPLKESSTGTSI